MNAADPKHYKAAYRNARLFSIWTREEHIEMDGPFARGCLIKRNRRDLPTDARIIGSRYVYKFKRHHSGRHRNKVKRCKVRLVVQGQHMSKEKGDFANAFAPVPHLSGIHLSGIRAVQSIATAHGWFAVTYDLDQGNTLSLGQGHKCQSFGGLSPKLRSCMVGFCCSWNRQYH